MDLTPGTVLGRYALVERIGVGGMGEVWEAMLCGSGGFRKPVALKLLHEGPDPGPGRAALLQEARLGAMLGHPNVVGTWEVGEADGRWFVAMELVRGPSVRALLDGGPPGPAAAVQIGLQVCAGLTHIHELEVEGHRRGLVHLDLKPDNLLVDRSGLVRIADLGVARLQGVRTDRVVGTPGYLAPEQLRGGGSPSSDLFSLGLVLAELVTGWPLLGRGSVALSGVQQMEQLLDDGLLDPVRAVEPELADVLHGCLRAQPTRRVGSASLLAEALRALPVLSGPGLFEVLADAMEDLRDEELLRSTVGSDAPGGGDSAGSEARGDTGSLPVRPGPLFGRADEVDAVSEALADHPVVTLRGPPGVGKTRLALEVAHDTTGVAGSRWWVSCVEVDTGAGVCAAVAAALDLRLRTDDPVEEVGRQLATRPAMLVVLDNVEQIADALAPLVASWSAAAPQHRFLATGRVGLPGAGWPVIDIAPLSAQAAVALFEARAAYPVAPADRAMVEALVERLDRLPLAVDLAAARMELLSPSQILDRLEQRFRLLSRRGGEGHRSLFAAMEASWELLGEAERAAYAELSVFVGGFDLEGAEAVLSASGVAPWAVELVLALVDHSLVQHDAGRQRFSMLPSVREHAASHLSAEATARAEHRHTEWCLRLVAGQPRPLLWSRERHNLRAAMERALEREDHPRAVTLGQALSRLLAHGHRASEVLVLTERLLRVAPTGWERRKLMATRAAALRRAGRFAEGVELLEVVLRKAREAGDDEQLGHLLVDRANLEWEAGADFERARALLEEALALAGTRHEAVRARALTDLATVLRYLGRLDDAAASAERGLELALALDLPGLANIAHNVAGILQMQLGETARARHHWERALVVARRIELEGLTASPIANLAYLAIRDGELTRATSLFRRYLALEESLGNALGAATGRCNLVLVLLNRGALAPARPVLEAAEQIFARFPPSPYHPVLHRCRSVLATLEDDPGAALQHALEALDLEQRHRAGETVQSARLQVADGELAVGRADTALQRVDRARAALDAMGDASELRGAVRLVRGRCLLALGRADEARAEVAPVLSGRVPVAAIEQVRVLALHARLQALDGDTGAAEATLARLAARRAEMGVGPGSLLAREEAEARREIEAAT